jgi:DNA polymerase III subunit gamma/tau
MAWYNIYRPSKFEDVVGQSLVKSVLENAIKHNKIKHGYLLSGPKGTGKTTLARIFANHINDTENEPQARLDIIELDAASNTGVDSIRQLIDTAQTPPMAGKYKVFIIDEVHMLSKSAMNALLKILEEPPTYLVFLLATTNPEKLIPTVLSRLTKLSLTSHTVEDISSRLEYIAKAEKMTIDKESRDLIAKRAGGGQRDAINLLETLYSYNLGSYDLTSTTSLLGLLPNDALYSIAKALLNQDNTQIKSSIIQIQNSGIDGESFLAQLLELLLEDTFENRNDLDSLILPIATILDLKLPINTVLASTALVQAQIRQNNIPKTSLPNIISELSKPDLPEKKTPKIAEEEQIQTPNLNYKQEAQIEIEAPIHAKKERPNQNKAPLEPKIATKIPDPKQTQTELTPSELQEQQLSESFGGFEEDISNSNSSTQSITPPQIQSLFESLKSDKTCPSILKLILGDIEVLQVLDSKIYCTLSSPLFLPQAKTPKTTEFLKEKILDKFGLNLGFDFELRKAKPTVLKDFSSDIGQNTNNVVSSKQEQVTTVQDSTSDITNTRPTQKYFYSVYKSLPENTVGDTSKVPMQLSPIQIPTQQTSPEPQAENWDEDLESMFDFE